MKAKTKRYDTNPFLNNLSIPIGNKTIRISNLGADNNVLVNQITGEISGTHVVSTKRVDKAKFVKVFADYMAWTFDLTKAGNKALVVTMWAVREKAIDKDQVDLGKYECEEFLRKHGLLGLENGQDSVMSYSTFVRGLGELERAKIIAKTKKAGRYFINPSCIFNGDRIAFTSILERQEKFKVIEVAGGADDNN